MSQATAEERYRIISENIRKFRLKKGLRQEEVAVGLCSVSQYSKIENGKSLLKPEVLKGIANRLGVSIEQLQTADDALQELREMLEMARNAQMVNQVDLSLEYAHSVAVQSKHRGEWELYERAIIQECQTLSHAFRFTEIIERLEQVLLDDQASFSPVNYTLFHLELGRSHAKTGNRDKSYTYFLKGEELYQELDEIDPTSIEAMRIPHMLSKGCMEMRNYQSGLRYSREAKRLAELNNRHVNAVNSKIIEGTMLIMLGDRPQAEQVFLQALGEAGELEALHFVGVLQNNLGCIHLMFQELGEAKSYFRRAQRNFELIQSWEFQCESLLNLAEVAMHEGEHTDMLLYTERVTKVLDVNQPQGYMYRARMHNLLSQMHVVKGHTEWGIRELERALYIYDQHHVFMEAHEVAVKLADFLHEQGDARALEYYRQAIHYDRKQGSLK